jgi:O-antigen/teichoic acid export membrane protein
VIRRVGVLLRRPATGAVAGQVTQAVAGLVLQVAAARFLGAAGLATFSLVYGAVVLVTAVTSGMVGDSLTVLDRHESGTRAGLHVWAVLVSVGAGVGGAVLAAATSLLTPGAAVVLAVAVTAFVLEDTLRRLLMATSRYWSLPAVDVTSLVLSVGALVVCALAGPLTLTSFLWALVVGQTGAAVVAYRCAPAGERPRGPWRSADLAGVWSFGIWRAAGQTVRPGLLTALRLVVVGLAGAAAYGPLEVARVYTAPTLVLVQGLGSFLLPHYVATRDRSPRRALRAADGAALGLAGAVAAITVVAVALRPVAEPLLTGGDYAVPLLAVAGWGAYAVAGAFLLPYSGLATVHRRQRRVLVFRLLEFAALGVVVLLTLLVPAGQRWAPLALAVGPLLAAAGVRQAVLRPLVRAEAAVLPQVAVARVRARA